MHARVEKRPLLRLLAAQRLELGLRRLELARKLLPQRTGLGIAPLLQLRHLFRQLVALAPRLAHRRLEGCERALQLLKLFGCRRSRLLRLGEQLLLQRQGLGEARESLRHRLLLLQELELLLELLRLVLQVLRARLLLRRPVRLPPSRGRVRAGGGGLALGGGGTVVSGGRCSDATRRGSPHRVELLLQRVATVEREVGGCSAGLPGRREARRERTLPRDGDGR
mmetsp:Transcript_39962/g.133240  ORF Transcript_39962/g.133240 Transcript_39962/m.133240 type:complete len:224 (+) Transcript_39962:1712-2383(+)